LGENKKLINIWYSAYINDNMAEEKQEPKAQPRIKLYQFEHCPYCEKVRQKLREKGLKWETVEVDRANKPEVVLKTGGLVPVIDIGGKIINESSVINEYLEENF